MPHIHLKYCTSIGSLEAEALTQLRRGILIDDFVRCRKRRYIGRDVVARRQLDKHKGKEADGETATGPSIEGV